MRLTWASFKEYKPRNAKKTNPVRLNNPTVKVKSFSNRPPATKTIALENRSNILKIIEILCFSLATRIVESGELMNTANNQGERIWAINPEYSHSFPNKNPKAGSPQRARAVKGTREIQTCFLKRE